ncbi:MAG TPA: HD domain-containing phosphohydrolase [Bacilli bacterium]|nr:HD domain-containing phosphohydrolase [Bacilli bacterium]
MGKYLSDQSILFQKSMESLQRSYIQLELVNDKALVPDFFILDVNDILLKQIQSPKNEIIGRKLSDLLSTLTKGGESLLNELMTVALGKKVLSMQKYIEFFHGWFQMDAYSSVEGQIHLFFYSIVEQMRHLEESTSLFVSLKGILFEVNEELEYTKVICQDSHLLFADEKTLIGKKVSDFFAGKIKEEVLNGFRIAKEEQRDTVIIYPSAIPSDNRIFKATIMYSIELKKYISNVVEITKEIELEQKTMESKEISDAFFALSKDLFAVLKINGTIIKVNEEWNRKLGYTEEELLYQTVGSISRKIDLGNLLREFQKNVTAADFFSFTTLFPDKLGNFYDIEWRGIIRNSLIYVSGRDITEKKNMEIELKTEKELLKTTLEFIGEGVITCSSDGIITYLNKEAEQMTEWSKVEAIGTKVETVFKITDVNQKKVTKTYLPLIYESEEIQARTYEVTILAKNHHEFDLDLSLTPIRTEDGKAKGFVLVFKKSLQKSEKLAKIKQLSYYDQLTNVYNRRFYEEKIKQLTKKKHIPLTLAMIDVNGLKLINDAFGHEAGDLTLQKVVKVMKKYVPSSDIIARIGGDEFVILFIETTEAQAKLILHKIYTEMPNEIVESVHLSISYGIHTKTKEEENIADIFKVAEDDMYSLKLSQTASMRTNTINIIMKTLFEKSEREEKHSKRVSEFCVKMGNKLQLSSQEVSELRVASTMHDIGKIAVDISILNKPDKLSDSEWLEVKRHPEVGYRILNSITEFAHLAKIVLCHHERWDGTGYPKKIAGESIPLMARIIGVADAFDAMTVGRPYRDALSFEAAKKELKDHRGTQFDPKIVDVFLDILDGSSDLKTTNVIAFEEVAQKVLAVSNDKQALFPKKDNLPTTSEQFLKDHGFSGYTMEFGQEKVLYFGYRSYIPLRAMEKSEAILPWQVTQPHTQGDRPMISVGLNMEGTISTSDPRGTGAMYHNINSNQVIVFSRHLYGYQGYRWGYERFGIIRISQAGVILDNYRCDLLEAGINITLQPGDYLLTLFEADRNALGGSETSFYQNPGFATGSEVKISKKEELVYFG